MMHDAPLSLLPHSLLDLTDLFLDFAGYLFIGPFSSQNWIVAQSPANPLELLAGSALPFIRHL